MPAAPACSVASFKGSVTGDDAVSVAGTEMSEEGFEQATIQEEGALTRLHGTTHSKVLASCPPRQLLRSGTTSCPLLPKPFC